MLGPFPAPPLTISATFPTQDSVVLAVAGEIDLATAPRLALHVLSMVEDCRPIVLSVDVAAVTFLDCSGIGMLVAVRTAAAHGGCHIQVVHPVGLVARLLNLAGVLDPPADSISTPDRVRSG